VPNQITERAYPFTRARRWIHDSGLFVQNKWTAGPADAHYGARYDYKANSFPEQNVGPALLAPHAQHHIPEHEEHRLSQTCRRSLERLLRSLRNGRTAVKATLNRYVAPSSASTRRLAAIRNPSTT
jgi:hypothetical protein